MNGLKAYIQSWLNYCNDKQSVVNKIAKITEIEDLTIENITNDDIIMEILNKVNPNASQIYEDVNIDYKEDIYSKNDLQNMLEFVQKSMQQKKISVSEQQERNFDEESLLMKTYIEELGVLEKLKNILKLDSIGYQELNNIKGISEIILATVDHVKNLDKSGKSTENYDEKDRFIKKWLKSIKSVFHPDKCKRLNPNKVDLCTEAFKLVNSIQDAEIDDDAK